MIGPLIEFTVQFSREEDQDGPHLFPFAPEDVIHDRIQQRDGSLGRFLEIGFKMTQLGFNRSYYFIFRCHVVRAVGSAKSNNF